MKACGNSKIAKKQQLAIANMSCNFVSNLLICDEPSIIVFVVGIFSRFFTSI
jgi:hypothetical protein